MRRLIALCSVAFLLGSPAGLVWAGGTPAGMNITNRASISFLVDATTVEQQSNDVTIQVAEVLDLSLEWQDSGNILVRPGEAGSVATLLLTNTGNGSEGFTLDASGSVAGNDFDPTVVGIYLDGNDNGEFEIDLDPLYIAGTNDPVLPMDAGVHLFLVSDIPAGAGDQETGRVRLQAAARTGSGSPGTTLAGAGDGGVNAVIGANGGEKVVEPVYLASMVQIDFLKSARVQDPFGGDQPTPGATITYTLTVVASGSGTAREVAITDPIPAYTTYKSGTLQLEGAPLSDRSGDDDGEVVEDPAGSGNYSVIVRLGDLQDTSKTVSFDVEID